MPDPTEPTLDADRLRELLAKAIPGWSCGACGRHHHSSTAMFCAAGCGRDHRGMSEVYVVPEDAYDRLLATLAEKDRHLAAIRTVVDEQAEDEGLWSLNLDGSLPISEAYLQQELRRLHAVVEGGTDG